MVGRDDIFSVGTSCVLDGPGDRMAVGIFLNSPDGPWGRPSLVCNGYRVFFPGVKRPGRGVNHPPASSAEVKRVELYLWPPPPPLCRHGRLYGDFRIFMT
jgi:hypothetical protein